ncbi:MAG: cobalamin-dependent protein [Kiritimatiellales bacterium]|nr:cobalamin-dependent protein [Kiritimatiellales bacterium]MCF7863213.1 cobalamin-dependent protein [Kiritimatiellales bacterium]
MKTKKLIYLQLPLLDNDAKGACENFPFAGAYLDHALQRSSEAQHHESWFPPTAWDDLDTSHLAKNILAVGVDIVVCTLYLWNIERTIDLAARLKQAMPGIKIAAGGPEVANNHPLLERAPFDAVATGEGEGVFPAILAAWRNGSNLDYASVGIRTRQGFSFGKQPPPPALFPVAIILPPVFVGGL